MPPGSAFDVFTPTSRGHQIEKVDDIQWVRYPERDVMKAWPQSVRKRHVVDAGRIERVFAAITGNAKLGQAEHTNPTLLRLVNRSHDAIAISVPIKRRLIEDASAKF